MGDRAARFVALALLTVVAACRGQATSTADATIEVQVTPSPPVVGPAQVSVGLMNSQGQPIEGAKVGVMGNMTHAGMAPVRVSAAPTGDGRYVAQNFSFTMAGDWVITVEATLPTGETATRTVAVNGVRGNGMQMQPSTEGQSSVSPATTVGSG